MLDWIKNNVAVVVSLALAAALTGACLLASGCNIGDIVQGDVPAEVQQALGAPKRASLNKLDEYVRLYGQWVKEQAQKAADALADLSSEAEREMKVVHVQYTQAIEDTTRKYEKLVRNKNREIEAAGKAAESGRAALATSVAEASDKASWLAGLTNTGIGAASGALSGVPGGAIGIGVLTYLGGLFTRRPGTQRELDQTHDTAQRDLLALLSQAGVVVPPGVVPPSRGAAPAQS